MPNRNINIKEEAYQRLKNLEKESFSEVILRYCPSKRNLSDTLKEIGVNTELPDSIEAASQKMRRTKI